jgi:hypothetical protein
MRTARFSVTARDQLNTLLEQGARHYSTRILEQKRQLVFAAIRRHILHFPAAQIRNPELGLHVYPVSKTPFVLLYTFDEREVRIHFVVHKSADRSRIDPDDVEW